MSILTEKPPEAVEVDGGIFNIDWDFATILDIFEIYAENTPDYLKTTTALMLFYETVPENIIEAENKMKWFICRGEEKSESNEKQVMDFTQDADLIYSAFYQNYGIDLSTKLLHWWKFIALLNGLPNNTALSSRIELRNINANEIKDTKQRAKIKKAQAKVEIKQVEEPERDRSKVFELMNEIQAERGSLNG